MRKENLLQVRKTSVNFRIKVINKVMINRVRSRYFLDIMNVEEIKED